VRLKPNMIGPERNGIPRGELYRDRQGARGGKRMLRGVVNVSEVTPKGGGKAESRAAKALKQVPVPGS